MPWTGGIASGSREFSESEERRVIAAIIKHTGRDNATSLEKFCREVDLPGRTVRAVLARHDGVEFVIHLAGDGHLYAAAFQDEADHTTRQLFSRATKLRARAVQREEFARNLPRRQGFLFQDDEPTDDGEDF